MAGGGGGGKGSDQEEDGQRNRFWTLIQGRMDMENPKRAHNRKVDTAKGMNLRSAVTCKTSGPAATNAVGACQRSREAVVVRLTRGRSPVRECRTLGSVRGALGNQRSYRDAKVMKSVWGYVGVWVCV